tara:strand:- start:459 stop:701 length:243 start_codon:yes stop_codon:yes gene_type:complete
MSAVRNGKHKLMVAWNAKNKVASRQLYVVDPNPTEEGRDIAEQNPKKADQLQSLLLAHLKRVKAEEVSANGGKKKKRKKK